MNRNSRGKRMICLLLALLVLLPESIAFAEDGELLTVGAPEKVEILLTSVEERCYRMEIVNRRGTWLTDWSLCFKPDFALTELEGAEATVSRRGVYTVTAPEGAALEPGVSFCFSFRTDRVPEAKSLEVSLSFTELSGDPKTLSGIRADTALTATGNATEKLAGGVSAGASVTGGLDLSTGELKGMEEIGKETSAIGNGLKKLTENKLSVSGGLTVLNPLTGSTLTSFTSQEKTEEIIWDALYEVIGNPYGVAGLMGNLYAESLLSPVNLETRAEGLLGYSDETYTRAVDSGEYKRFTSDFAGYGLAQWTTPGRKKGLLEYAQENGTSIGALETQLGFLAVELQTTHQYVLYALQHAGSVRAASDYVLHYYEAPLIQDEPVELLRASFSRLYYRKYGDITFTLRLDSSGKLILEQKNN